MSKRKQNVILFLDVTGQSILNYSATPLKSGNSYMNRFSINEESSFEILGIYHLKKQKSDEQKLFDGIKLASEKQISGYECHFIFAGDESGVHLVQFVLEGMRKYSINSAMVSNLSSVRNSVITKEEVDSFCNGKFKEKDSIHDDLDSFFERICLGEVCGGETSQTYFLPKLSETEMKLFEANDAGFMRTLRGCHESVDDERDETFLNYNFLSFMTASLRHSKNDGIKKSTAILESKTKYLRGICFRHTFLIDNYIGQIGND